jgi:xanthine dehydrogenase accessory factor
MNLPDAPRSVCTLVAVRRRLERSVVERSEAPELQELAERARRWLSSGTAFAAVEVISVEGIGGARSGELAVRSAAGDRAGTVLHGALDEALDQAASELLAAPLPVADPTGLLELEIALADDAAVAAGLACGGVARVRLCRIDRTDSLERLLDRAVELIEVVVFGAGVIAGAILAQGGLCGWAVEQYHDSEPAAVAAASARSGDGVIVLDHDHDAATHVLRAALENPARPYVAALGSRHTQAVRRERLERSGVRPDVLARLRGPAGLDLGARSPSETALSILAELLSVSRGRDARPLSAGSGPING